jgi:hypothetical protein
MKNFILLGASRAGKSTFTRLLNERIKNLMIIRTDMLRLAFREAICKDTSMRISYVKENPDYRNYVLSYYKYENMYDPEYVKVIDTVDFEPKDCDLFDNAVFICLGYPNISKEELLSNWRKYDTEADWTKTRSDEVLLKFAEGEIETSKRLQQECDQYAIKFVDTSYDREEVLNELLEETIRMISENQRVKKPQ